MEAVSRSRRRGSAWLAFNFFAGLNPRSWIASSKAGNAVARSSSLASTRDAAKIALYRLIGLNGWAARRLDIYLSLRAYRKAFGRNADLAHPSLFCEKVTARKLFERRPIFSLIADKLLARDLAAGKIGAQYLPKLHAICERFEEIDFDRLPDKFVIKPNHGTHWVLPVEDKTTLDKTAARKLVNRWLKTNYYVNSREIFYKNVKPRIMIEELLQEASGDPVIDYRFFVFDGVAKFVTLQQNFGARRTVARYDRAGARLPEAEAPPATSKRGAYIPPAPADHLVLPPNIKEMFEIADRLGQGFDFMRVDLYNPGGRILFGELTTLPYGGVRPINPPIFDRIYGQEWKLNLGGGSSRGAEENQHPIAAARDAVKIALYRLIGLNARAARRLDLYLSLRAYRKTFGRNPNLAQPSLFTEKVTARKLFERRTVFSMLADKLQARTFAAERIGAQYLPKLLTVCERFDEIDFDQLPGKFVIKANHGTHWVLIVEDKATFDKAAARRSINRWLKTNYYVNSREHFYKDVKPRIMIEELLEEASGAPVNEYRFFCYDGVAKFLSVHQQRSLNGGRTQTRFTRARERMPLPINPPTARPDAPPPFADTDFPANMDKMFELADTLAQGFDFIRVDLYDPAGRILFGEMTSLPMGGVRRMNPPIHDEILGREWNLQLGKADA